MPLLKNKNLKNNQPLPQILTLHKLALPITLVQLPVPIHLEIWEDSEEWEDSVDSVVWVDSVEWEV